MTEPLGFIHRDYSIFINNENDLIMKRLYLWVFFCSRITLTNCFMANISSPLSPLKSTVILSEDMASASCIDAPRR